MTSRNIEKLKKLANGDDIQYWYKKATEQEIPEAQLNLGNCFYLGKEVEVDYKKAVYWYTKAAKQGYFYAQFNLGICYENGIGVKVDFKKAVYWYTKAAKQGYSYAQFNLGNCYYMGNGIEQDFYEAEYWFMKAFNQGDTKARNYVLYCCSDELEVEDNYREISEGGDPKAQYQLGLCYEKGTGVEKDC